MTCYFNPVGYRRRLGNYHIFRQLLKLPLVTVELAYADFQLGPGDADILVQVRGRDVLWQKERLLNVALQAVPPSCRKIAWLDCDVVFGQEDWAHRASAVLESVTMVQLLSHLFEFAPEATREAVDRFGQTRFMAFSFAHVRRDGSRPEQLVPLKSQHEGTPGLAWAARRELLEQHGLYDAGILGSGDHAIAYAAAGEFQPAIDAWCMNDRQRQHYLDWAVPFSKTVGGNIGLVPGDIYHLWHGSVRDRGYRRRHIGLMPFQFDPYLDIALDKDSCWRWNSKKRAMHDYVRRYFESRSEDG